MATLRALVLRATIVKNQAVAIIITLSETIFPFFLEERDPKLACVSNFIKI